MVSGFDKYFQIAPCFRDEDARADRSPGEFYQLDIEMSFVEQEDVFQIVEKLMVNLFKQFSSKEILSDKFPRISYKESMSKYGTDKPDLRNPLIITDITKIFTREDSSKSSSVAIIGILPINSGINPYLIKSSGSNIFIISESGCSL